MFSYIALLHYKQSLTRALYEVHRGEVSLALDHCHHTSLCRCARIGIVEKRLGWSWIEHRICILKTDVNEI